MRGSRLDALAARGQLAEANPNLIGIAAMIGASALFVVNDAMVKLVRVDLPASEIIAVRGVFSVAFVIGLARVAGIGWGMPLLLKPLVALRAVLEVAVALLFITALGSMALPDITAILQAVPLMVTALSVVLLGTQVGWRRWAAIAVGFVGVLMVVKPGGGGLEPAALLALAAAIGVSFRDIITRRIDASVPSLVVTLSAMLATTLTGFALWPLAGGWALPSIGNTLLLACSALGVAGGSYLIIVAMRVAEIPVVSPFRYTTIFFALALGFAVWGDLPDLLGTAGIALIVGAGIYTIHREAVRARG